MARTYEFSVGPAEAGQRLDRYLITHLPESVSRAMVQRRIREGLVTVSARPAKAHQKLRRGDVVTAAFAHLPPPARDVPMTPQDIPLEVVYEDAAVLVVNKPSGLVTHPAPGHWDGTLVNAILWYFSNAECGVRNAESTSNIPHSEFRTPHLARAGIVHRLDKDTSGLLLVAKTEPARVSLAKQMKARTIHRRYLAVVEGLLPLDTGTINASLGRHPKRRKEVAIRHIGGRTAVTHYRVLKRFSIDFPCTLIDVSLETGRTHQIRVHLASLGHPVAGDATYGKRSAAFWHALEIPRHLLHAYRLSFQHPSSGRPVTVTAPLPVELQRWCDPSLLPPA
jgi:23S rRNA pseudouridine1911/1915/1917 synthase